MEFQVAISGKNSAYIFFNLKTLTALTPLQLHVLQLSVLRAGGSGAHPHPRPPPGATLLLTYRTSTTIDLGGIGGEWYLWMSFQDITMFSKCL